MASQLDSDNFGQSNAAQKYFIVVVVFTIYYLLTSMLKPFGYSISNFRIQR